MIIKKMQLCDIACNTYIVTDEESGDVAVIDPSFCLERLIDEIEPIKRKVKLILLTHRHFDHLLGAAGVKKMCPDAKIAIHSLDAVGLLSKEDSLCDLFGVPLPHGQTEVKPDILLEDGDELLLGQTTLSVMHTPGHTAGSIMYIADGVIFSGDTIFDGSIGRTDLATGSMQQMRNSLRKIRSMNGNYTVYAGHGEDFYI